MIFIRHGKTVQQHCSGYGLIILLINQMKSNINLKAMISPPSAYLSHNINWLLLMWFCFMDFKYLAIWWNINKSLAGKMQLIHVQFWNHYGSFMWTIRMEKKSFRKKNRLYKLTFKHFDVFIFEKKSPPLCRRHWLWYSMILTILYMKLMLKIDLLLYFYFWLVQSSRENPL